MESSGSVPLEIRRTPAPQARWSLATTAAAVAGGVLLVGAGVLALATQDLATPEQLNGALVVVVGAMAIVWGARRLRNRRGLLRTDVVLRLDDAGVGAVTGFVADGPGWASVSWADLDRIELGLHHFGPPYYREDFDAQVLRFVAVDDAAITVANPSPHEAVKGAALGISPTAAALAMILGPVTGDRPARIREWLAVHRPDVRVVGLD